MPRIFDALTARLAALIAPRVRDQLVSQLVGELNRHLEEQVVADVQRRADAVISERFLIGATERIADALAEGVAATAKSVASAEIEAMADTLAERMAATAAQRMFSPESGVLPLVGSALFLPGRVASGTPNDTYMTASTPLTRDFLHPKFAEFAARFGIPVNLHRKGWEWAFIHERLSRAGMLRPGKRGLGFGVGREGLPALFASEGVAVTATDSPSDEQNWSDSDQYGGSPEHLFHPHIISRELFDERVRFEPCDMTRLPAHLSGYDFCWSSCCFEHLGNLQRGFDFVVESLERTLVIGGVACHTTELNLSSDEETIETGRDVIYRRQDLLRLCNMLEDRGHQVDALNIEPGTLPPDYLVDVPPYRGNPHLKLLIDKFVTTSAGLMIRRGR